MGIRLKRQDVSEHNSFHYIRSGGYFYFLLNISDYSRISN